MGAGRGDRLPGKRRPWWLIIFVCAIPAAGTVLLGPWASPLSWLAPLRDLTAAVFQWVRELMIGIPEISLFIAITGLIASLFLAWKQRQWSQQGTRDDRRSARGRSLMLRRVRNRWMVVLNHALGDELRISLGLVRRRDLARQSVVLVPAERQEPETLVSAERIETVFSQVSGMLLLLGAPGSGKTVALLELTRELLSAAESDERQPIPAVFNLASWSSQKLPLDEWMVAELHAEYEIPPAIAQRWVDFGEILPLLDGLDEVDEIHRAACVKAINAFYSKELVKLVVVCRTQAYVELSARLSVDEAIELQPPTRSQVSDYLSVVSVVVTEIQNSAQDDPGLWELLQSPLVLNIVAQAYRGESVAALRTEGTHQQRMAQLFEIYVERMLVHRSGRYTRQRMLEWLIWIARSMRDRRESEFHLDRLQPDRLPTATQQWLATVFPGVMAGLLVGGTEGLIYSLLRGPDHGVVNGVAWGISFGLFIGIRIPESTRRRRRFWMRIIRGAQGGLVLGLIFWLLLSAVDALVAGLLFTLAFGLLAELRRAETVEDVRRSWSKTGLGILRGIVVGGTVGLIYGYSYGVVEGVVNSLIFASSFALTCGFIVGSITGLVPGLVEKRTTPNEGIYRSARRALTLGLPAGILSGFVFALVFSWTSSMVDGIGQGLRNGLLLGLAVALLYGGQACLQHLSVRGILVCYGRAPVSYVRFLEEATDRLIMLRAGSGYIFIHRLLLEYLADLDVTEKP